MNNSEQIVVGANGTISTAPVGSTIPADITIPLGEAWAGLGYVSEDGVKWIDSKTTATVPAWQSFYGVRRITEAKEGSVEFGLMQWNADTVGLALGGGTVTGVAGKWRFEPAAPEDLDERALAVEWSDGDRDYRLVFPKGNVSESMETELMRSEAAILPITFSLLGVDGSAPFVLDTNDPAFAPAGS